MTELDKELNEECAEYQSDKSLKKLTDMFEVVYAIVKARATLWKNWKRFGLLKERNEADLKIIFFLYLLRNERLCQAILGNAIENCVVEMFDYVFGAAIHIYRAAFMLRSEICRYVEVA